METATIQILEFETTQTTDPRETKLKEIIQKGKVSLHRALEEIQFVDDLIIYLDYKIREAERIRNERKQLSFW